jgi:spermidine synthase
VSWLFLAAYTCSGIAGLIYQVCWTRLLTLYLGHSTAAASAVVAAFLGGLAAGAAVAGAYASRLTSRQALIGYAALEALVAGAALALPLEIRLFEPLLASAYADGTRPVTFGLLRLAACLVMVFVPATALGATFPLAVRWFTADSDDRARSAGVLYALNTAGAAAGALLAGFLFIPRLGITRTTWIGVAASLTATACVAVVSRYDRSSPATPTVSAPRRAQRKTRVRARHINAPWLAALVLGLSGFAALLHEIAWTRVLTMVFGPTTYAFAATLAAVIIGIAIGAALSASIVSRTRQPALWLAIVLACAGGAGILTSALAGGPLPRLVAEQIARSPDLFGELLWRGAILTAALVIPTSALIGAAFPLALALIDDPARSAASEFGTVYAVNTLGSVAGSLAAGFLFIPALGLETTLRIVMICLAVSAVLVLSFGVMTTRARIGGAIASVLALSTVPFSAPWDRELLASGVYLYAPFIPQGLPLEPLLKAGQLLYYREGATGTVSVKRLTGTNTLAVDGKTDASNRGDMLTQKLVGHLPLLLHPAPRQVAIVGLGSGVTAGAVLTHPVDRVDVIELSPEVVEASAAFLEENRSALADPRARLLVADGRSHLQFSGQKYDVLISEPSNPWIAGVAALFTREFFLTARARLAPGGIICQWANAYNISDQDLRAIVATFQSVFPNGTAWLVGADDVVLIASDQPLDARLRALEQHFTRAGVADDLKRVRAMTPFTLLSLFVAGPRELGRYSGGAALLTDDRMTLEFSAPRELGSRRAGGNSATLKALLDQTTAPPAVREWRARATFQDWSDRADMMAGRDAFTDALQDYSKALSLAPNHPRAIGGLVRMAILTHREAEVLAQLEPSSSTAPTSRHVAVARSRLLAARGDSAAALAEVQRVLDQSDDAGALEQLASLHADAGDVARLDVVVERMRRVMPAHAATHYFAAVAQLLGGNAAAALRAAEASVAIDRDYAAAYDLIGAAHSQLGDRVSARDAFMTSLRFDAHDSTAYANLGVLAFESGAVDDAIDYFAEALWLDPNSAVAREGLRRAWH